MKIMICGSMAFIKDILDVKKKLDRLGYTALIPHYDKARWAQEVRIMQPIIISGDLTKIK